MRREEFALRWRLTSYGLWLRWDTVVSIIYLLSMAALSQQCKDWVFAVETTAFPGGSVVKNLPANAGDAGSIPGSGRSYRVGNSNPLQYSCQDNPMDRGTWWAAVHRGRKSQTRTTKWLQLSSDSKLLIAVSFYIIREKSGKEFRCMFSIHQILFISLFCISIQVLPHFRQRKQINSFLCDFSLFSLVFSLIWAYSLPN